MCIGVLPWLVIADMYVTAKGHVNAGDTVGKFNVIGGIVGSVLWIYLLCLVLQELCVCLVGIKGKPNMC